MSLINAVQLRFSLLLPDTKNTAQICRSTSLFKIHNEDCRFVEVLLTSRSTTNTADLPKFFSLKIYIKHCRFFEVLLSSRSTTNTVDLSKLFSLQVPQQTLHIRRFFRTGAGTSSTESGNIAATQDGCNEIPRACMHRIDQFVSPPRRPQIFVLISGGSEQNLDLFLAALHV
jgi:hypothetical protein